MDSPANGQAKGGRPRWQHDLSEVERLASIGLNYRQVSAALGISTETLLRRRRGLAQFNAALERGRARGIREVANKLYAAAIAGDVRAAEFFLRSVGGFREKTELGINVTGTLEFDARQAEHVQRLSIARSMTMAERREVRAHLAAVRQIEQTARSRIEGKPVQPAIAIETTAKPIN